MIDLYQRYGDSAHPLAACKLDLARNCRERFTIRNVKWANLDSRQNEYGKSIACQRQALAFKFHGKPEREASKSNILELIVPRVVRSSASYRNAITE